MKVSFFKEQKWCGGRGGEGGGATLRLDGNELKIVVCL